MKCYISYQLIGKKVKDLEFSSLLLETNIHMESDINSLFSDFLKPHGTCEVLQKP